MAQERNVVVACGLGSADCGRDRWLLNVAAFCRSVPCSLADGLRSF